jgi:two-component system, NtrC family, nitrogen regulation sensor histidine kinase NtrY
LNPSHTIKSFLYKNAYLPIIAAWLFTFSFLFQYYWSYTSAPAQVRKTIERSIKTRHADFEQLLSNVQLTERLFNFNCSKEEFNTVSGKDYFIFLAQYTGDGPELKFWNTQIIQPTNTLWYHEDGEWFQKLINGYYVVIRKTIQIDNNKTVAALALIPVKWDYFITTNDLNNSFAYLSSIENYYDLSNTTVTELPVRDQQNEILFYLTQKVNTPQPLSLFTIFLRLSAMFCVLWLVHRAAVQIARQKSFAAGFVFLAVLLIGARVLSYYKPFPVNFRQFELFDPSVYSSDIILKSLGDFLINVLLLMWLLLFAKTNTPGFLQFKFVKGRYILGLLIAGVMYIITLYFGNAVRSLVADSQISFDVTNFFSLSAYSFVGFFILGCLSVCCYLLFEWLLQLLNMQSRQQLFIEIAMLVFAGFVYLSITINSGRVPFHLGLLIWVVLFVTLYRMHAQLFSFIPQSAYSLFWLLFFSVSLTALLLAENSTKEWADRKRMAEKLSLQTDPAAENLLSIALNNFRTEFFQENFSRFRTQGGNQYLKDSLLGEHFSGYLNKFETKIFTYTADEQSLFNDDSTSFSTLNTIYNLQSKILNTADWRYYEESFDRFYYLARREVTDTSTFKIKGYVFVLSKPRRYSGEKFYPELFSKTFNLQTDFTPAYAYAIYKNDELVNSYNDYPFAIHLPQHHTTPSGFHEHTVDGFSELWYNATPSRAVVVVKRKDGWLQAITMFAYLFLVFLMMFVLFRVLQTFSQNKLSLQKWKETAQFNFRTQVHTTITAISVFSFFVIGVSTIFFFINRHSRSNKERLSRTIQIMRSEVEQALQQQSIMDDMIKVYDDVSAGDLQLKVNRISEIHGVDVNVYDPSGSLRVSSQPYYYNKGLLSRRMEPHAYFRLSKDMLVQTIDFEKVGSRSYMSIYVPVRDEKGRPYAFLNIPYFTSQNELRQEISSFLVTLINLNAVIFLVAGIIAFFVTNRITSSFTFISDKMKEIKLGKANEAILWNRTDEIGELVAEYNKMVLQLEASAALLAKSEREGAWREMARQVAHEIKNPLTPMKLSIQYLQKAVDNNAADTRELSKSVAKTLVEQIDYLSNIASDFSNFANIGTAKLERINLQQSLQSVIDLFGVNAESEIAFEAAASQALFVMGDKTQLNRLFTNLIRNAIESVPAERKSNVQVTVQPNDLFIIVVIKDNGDGIEPDLRDKIFYPNFTTKTSGTGLGLAMCKGIVEQMKGEIWFETETGRGTSFFVKMERG